MSDTSIKPKINTHEVDGMRFWAKLGRQEAYKSILVNILMILNKYGITINNS